MSEELPPEITEAVIKLFNFMARKTEDCPFCGNHVDSLEQVERCVYAAPCGHRIWQGSVPDEWKGLSNGT